VPKINQKNGEKWRFFLQKMGYGLVGDKTGNIGNWVAGGGWVWWRRAGGGDLVVGEAMGGGGLVWESGILENEGRRKGFGKKGNGGVREVGGGLVWWRMAGDGVSVVGEAVGGGGLRWFWILGR
jgi:hypothetical protein